LPAFSGVLANFTPCVLPGYEHLIADWARDAGEGEPLFAPGRKPQSMGAMKEAQKIRPKACAGCAYASRCLGVDREYLGLFGAAEFKPLSGIPEPAPIRRLSGGQPG
jgi:hypothetical protein